MKKYATCKRCKKALDQGDRLFAGLLYASNDEMTNELYNRKLSDFVLCEACGEELFRFFNPESKEI